MPPTPASQSRLTTVLCAAALIIPCVAYAVLGDAPVFVFSASPVLVLAIIINRPAPITTRAVVYTLTIAAITAIVFNETYPIEEQRFFFPLLDVVFPFVIALGVCATFFAQTRIVLATILALALFALVVQGSCVNEYENTRFVVDWPLLHSRYWVFGLAVACEAVVMLPLLYRAQGHAHMTSFGVPRTWRRRKIIYALAVMAWALTVLATCRIAVGTEKVLEPIYRSLLSMYFRGHRTKIVWGRDVDLFRQLDPTVRRNADAIILRAGAEHMPGYLRGRAYHTYHNGTWRSGERQQRLSLMHTDSTLASNRFHRGTQEPDAVPSCRVDVLPARDFYSDVILAPAHSVVFELIADEITTNVDGELGVSGWERTGGYTVFGRVCQSDAAYTSMSEFPRSTTSSPYLSIPDTLNDTIRHYADNLPVANNASTTAQVQAVADFLTTHCSYSLDFTPPSTADPVATFLTERRAGHCELFATAAAMLLRARGIESRYVTGFICAERHPRADYWIARVGDCHAWVEAFLPDEERWILVEATPPIGIPAGVDRTSLFVAGPEHIRASLQLLYSRVKRGYFADAVLGGLADAWTSLRWLFWHGPWYVGWGVLTGLLLLLWKWRRVQRPRDVSPPYAIELNQALRQLERLWEARGVKRLPVMSVGDLVGQIQQTADADGERLIRLLRTYETLRYSPEPPSMAAIAKFRTELELATA